jgi:hypothetical protein
MKTGRTFTTYFEIEPRQHDIAGFDLAEGPTRRVLIIGALAYAVWLPLMVLILGTPDKFTLTLFVLPPAVFVRAGELESATNPRRKRMTGWALRLRRALVGHRTIIHLGRRQPARHELEPWRTRLPAEAVLQLVMPWREPREHGTGEGRQSRLAGGPITMQQRARLYGAGVVYAAHVKQAQRGRRRAKC